MEAFSVVVENLSFTYPDGTEALKGASLRVDPGVALGMVGPNGAGKSSLLLHLNGVLEGEGMVKIGDMQVAKENLQEIRRRVGLVFQDPDDQLFMPTVYDDVAFGPLNLGYSQSETKERVERALESVRLSGLGEKAPYNLSGGQKRLAAIATVLSMEPGVLVLDEPTSNLDHRSRRALINVLKDLKMTKIVCGHDLEFIIETCDEVCIVDQGKVMTHGATDKILSDEALLLRHGIEMPHSLLHRRGEHAHDE